MEYKFHESVAHFKKNHQIPIMFDSHFLKQFSSSVFAFTLAVLFSATVRAENVVVDDVTPILPGVSDSDQHASSLSTSSSNSIPIATASTRSAVAVRPAETVPEESNAVQNSFDVQDIPLSQAFRFDPPLPQDETVSFRFLHMTPLQAFQFLADSRGFHVVNRNGVTTLSRPDITFPSFVTVKKYPLRYIDSKWLIQDIANLLGITLVTPSTGGSPAFGISNSMANSSGANNTLTLATSGQANNSLDNGGGVPTTARWTSGIPFDAPLSTKDDSSSNSGNRSSQGSAGSSGSSKASSGKSSTAIFEDRKDNAIVVKGTPEEQELVMSYISQCDRPEPKILIEAAVVEVTLDKNSDMGVDWSGVFQSGVGLNVMISNSSTSLSHIFSSLTSPGTAGGTTVTLSTTQMQAVMRAFATSGRSSVLTRPTVITRSGVPVSIHSSQTNPVLLQQAPVFGNVSGSGSAGNNGYVSTSGGEQVQSFPTGIMLDVLPKILADGQIDMNINPTIARKVSTVVQQNANGANVSIPVISNQNVPTTTNVRSGTTVVIGGLISNDEEDNKTGVPPFSNLPFGKFLSGERVKASTRQTLLVFVTPRIVYPNQQTGVASESVLNEEMHKLEDGNPKIQVEDIPRAIPVSSGAFINSDNKKVKPAH